MENWLSSVLSGDHRLTTYKEVKFHSGFPGVILYRSPLLSEFNKLWNITRWIYNLYSLQFIVICSSIRWFWFWFWVHVKDFKFIALLSSASWHFSIFSKPIFKMYCNLSCFSQRCRHLNCPLSNVRWGADTLCRARLEFFFVEFLKLSG